MNKLITISLLLALVLTNAISQTIVQEGEVSGEWTMDNSPYLISGDLYIEPEERLSIQQGVRIIFQGPYNFAIAGRIEAIGTVTDSIIFTVQDATGFGGDNYEGWTGLHFIGYNSSTSENSYLTYCIIEYSSFNGLTCEYYSNLEVSHSQVRYNMGSGITLYEYSNISAHDITVYGNMDNGFDCIYSGPAVEGFTITNNAGNGLYISGSSNAGNHAVFMNGLISNNTGASFGGGINLQMDAFIELENVEISNNSAVLGGGLYATMAFADLNKVVFSGNHAEKGGGLYISSYCELNLDHSLVVKNMANGQGGAIYVEESGLNLNHCTVAFNTSGELAGGVYFDNFYITENNIENSILWNNLPEEIVADYNAPLVSYSNVAGGFEGDGNIGLDPLFVDPGHSDFNLSWWGFPYDNDKKSPCIDAGNPSTTLDPDGTIADMGALFFEQDYMTGVNQVASANHYELYPNPVVDRFTISGLEDCTKIEIRNLAGSLVSENIVNGNQIRVDFSGYNSGLYIVVFYGKNGSLTTEKIIKK